MEYFPEGVAFKPTLRSRDGNKDPPLLMKEDIGKYAVFIGRHRPLDIDLEVVNDAGISLKLHKVKKIVECPEITIINVRKIFMVEILPQNPYIVVFKVDTQGVKTLKIQVAFVFGRRTPTQEYEAFSIEQSFHVTIFQQESEACDVKQLTSTGEVLCLHPLFLRPFSKIPPVQVREDIKPLLEAQMQNSGNMSIANVTQLEKLLYRYSVEGVTLYNYKDYFEDLLYMELYEDDKILKEFSEAMTSVTITINKEEKIVLKVPGMRKDDEASLIPDSVVFSVVVEGKEVQFQGKVLDVDKENLVIGKLDKKFLRKYKSFLVTDKPLRMNVRFLSSDYGIRVKMFSLYFVLARPHLHDVIFPKQACEAAGELPKINFFNKNVEKNEEQKLAVLSILNGSSKPAPYVVFGPAGTGKTLCLVEAIMQVLVASPKNKVLVCTPSNNACDHIASQFLDCLAIATEKGRLPRHSIQALRYIAKTKSVSQDMAFTNKLCCAQNMSVTFSTLTNSVNLRDIFHKYTHVFIDEAGQPLECEVLTGLMSLHPGGQLVLAGDPKQLGPICHSDLARDFGLGTSFLDRLIDNVPLYKRNDDGEYNSRYITMLRDNYRCHPQILSLPNRLFYNSMLRSKCKIDPLSDYCLTTGACTGGSALIFHGVLGREEQFGISHSYHNTEEADLVVKYCSKFLQPTFPIPVKEEDIGVVTPYNDQVSKIRQKLADCGWQDITVGCAEVFQGQERRIIIASTVRSQAELDEPRLGFVRDKRRFNVMITRAVAKCIIIGNPLLLHTDQTWRCLIEEAIIENRYLGVKVGVENAVLVAPTFAVGRMQAVDPLTSYSFKYGEKSGGTNRLVHGICGIEKYANDYDNSLYNEMEIGMVLAYLEKMLNKNFPIAIEEGEICVISPFPEQIHRIRKQMEARGLGKVVAGTPQLFEDIQKRVVVVSTVRSPEDSSFELELDLLANAATFELLMSRAKAKTIVIGNPVVLSSNENWRTLIAEALSGDFYDGDPIEFSD